MITTSLIKPLSKKNHRLHHNKEYIWLFDLDNTLHNSSAGTFPAIDQSMAQAVMTSLNVDVDEANRLRDKYWRKYGATAIGLSRHHNIDMHNFLEISHNFDIEALAHKERSLARSIQQLPGQKYIFTNAPMHYAKRILAFLKIEHCFSGICAINTMNLQGCYIPKPSKLLMQQMLAQLNIRPERIIFVEDTAHNLLPAHQLGMKTVHIYHQGTPFAKKAMTKPSYIDIHVNSIHELFTHPFVNTLS